MDDLISRQAVLDIAFKYCPDDDGVCSEAGRDLRNMLDEIENLPPAEPKRETTTLRIGRTRNSVTMWYECAECGEPVDHEDAFCRRCGREIIHE